MSCMQEIYTCDFILQDKTLLLESKCSFFFLNANLSKRLNYVNHARRLADGDWTGADSDGEEDMEKQASGEREQDGNTEEEGMEIERRRLPKHYANQVRA